MTGPDVPFSTILATFGQPATVRRPPPDDDPIETSVSWFGMQLEAQPATSQVRRVQGRRLLAVGRADVPTLPRGTQILVPEPPSGSTARAWVVDAAATPQDFGQTWGFDHHRVIVVEDESYVGGD